MSLPLLTRTRNADVRFALTPGRTAASGRVREACGDRSTLAARMPSRALATGEQYRFHVDMGRCIGCKCCVVACNEQNGNPAAINWRRVAEIEGGWYPRTSRTYLSMGCNHCIDPTCLSGCPVDAYSKDPVTGIVRHSAETCIGCQYCTWNCSYGVPQYNPERGVVGKCDMCHGRLLLGQVPACVSACPEGAIAIEIVNVREWQAGLAAAAAGKGLPIGDGSASTTRVTLARPLPPDARPVNLMHVSPEHPHWSLVVMTVLTQLSVGAFVAVWLLQVTGAGSGLPTTALLALAIATMALGGATLHLGRPAYAYRALKMWRRSWLSREVALFGAFSAAAALYAGLLLLGGLADGPPRGSFAIGALCALFGIAGVTASAYIYRVPSRPAWNTPFTLLQFNLTGGALGPLFVAASGATDAPLPAVVAAIMAAAQLLLVAVGFLRLIATDSVELRGTARLLSTTLKAQFIARVALLGVGGVALPLVADSVALLWTALIVALAGELAGRYLFFVSVVPRHMAAAYLELGSEAA
jgi:Fe-S-cluster-containing dehydrogenase component/DMSO reductase anchor subunit